MCLITDQKEPIILDEDLVVYKVMEDTNEGPRSLNQYYLWTIGVENNADIKESKYPRFADVYDYETLNDDTNPFEDMIDFIERTDLIAFGRGLHFMKSIDRCNKMMSYGTAQGNTIYKCLIPKGAEVYFNASDLGVTNKLTVLEKVV